MDAARENITLTSCVESCNINDDSGKRVKSVKVTGNGNASFDEFKSNFSLASVRASNDALAKLIQALADTPELRK